MIDAIVSMMSYSFMVRAAVAGIMISLCAALLGVSLVLKRYAMIGDGLSHVGFGALAIATVLNIAPLTLAVPVVVIAAFLLLKLSESSRIKGDSAIAVISSGSLAVGVMAVSVVKGTNTDIYSYMFGSILSITTHDAWLCVILSAVIICLYILLYNRIFAVTFDETFAKATGTNTGLYNMIIAMMTAVTIVLGMRMMGTLLISSLIIFPALTAMRLFKTFRSVIICSSVVSVVCFCGGMILSYFMSAPTGASIVAVNLFALIAFSVVRVIVKTNN